MSQNQRRTTQPSTLPRVLLLANDLASAHVVPTLADALNGVHWSIALTARLREYGPPQWTPRAAAGAHCRLAPAETV